MTFRKRGRNGLVLSSGRMIDPRLERDPVTDTVTLAARPDTCYWGYLDAAQPAIVAVDSGTELSIEAVTHHAGDAPDLMMDDGIAAIWAGIPEADRSPGVHIMTGPVHVRGATPGGALRVDVLAMAPRLPYGSNCAAHWGLLYDRFGKERITIYELDGADLDAAMRMAAETMLALLVDRVGFTADEAYSLASVAIDLGVTQVVDGTLGCHAAIATSIVGNLLGV